MAQDQEMPHRTSLPFGAPSSSTIPPPMPSSNFTADKNHLQRDPKSTLSRHWSVPTLPHHDPPVREHPPSSIPIISQQNFYKQCQDVLDQQRHTFDQERALWKVERDDLYRRIQELERRLNDQHGQAMSRSQSFNMGNDTLAKVRRRSHNSLGSAGSRSSSTSSAAGEEIWRGGDPLKKAARSFSDKENQDAAHSQRLPSINEEERNSRRVSISEHVETINVPSVSVSKAAMDSSLDGIMFKTPSSKAGESVERIVRDEKSPSPSQISPHNLSTRPSAPVLSSLEALTKDPYTADAGHTPLAHVVYPHLDGNVSLPDSGQASPTRTSAGNTAATSAGMHEKVGFDTGPPVPKPPLEKHDSYFPAAAAEHDNLAGSGDIVNVAEDPALAGPLGLSNNMAQSEELLQQLNDKLLKAAEQGSPEITKQVEATGAEKPYTDDHAEAKADEAEDSQQAKGNVPPPETSGPDSSVPAQEPQEPEPKLRIKRSMNFGTPLGRGPATMIREQ